MHDLQLKLTIGLFIIALCLVGASQTFFTVDQREQAIVLQLGEPKGDIRGPGLHIKIPLIQEVRTFDKRVLSVDPAPEQVVISSANTQNYLQERQRNDETNSSDTAEEDENSILEDVSGEPIIVDTFARYRIVDPLKFYKKLTTISRANSRIENILNDATRAVLGNTTLKTLLSTQRTNVMEDIKERVNQKVQEDLLGIEIVDIRIVRADLTADLRTSTVRRMISELNERATETRAKGDEIAREISSTAEKERTVILAEAERDAQITRGEGDELSIKIYAKAFNRDKDFYAFLRSMEAYGKTLADPDTQLILSPDSDFFRFFDAKTGNKGN